jgi:hypothetical protein
MTLAEKYQGKVIRVRHTFRMDHHGEDVLVWDSEANKPVLLTQGQGSEYLKVDATEEVLAKYHNYQVERNNAIVQEDELHNARVIEVGKTVVVARGKKVPTGTIGTVKAIQENSYDNHNKRVTLVDSHGTLHYTYMKNLDILVNGNQYAANAERRDRRVYVCSGTY